jgi:hypothetical protein
MLTFNVCYREMAPKRKSAPETLVKKKKPQLPEEEEEEQVDVKSPSPVAGDQIPAVLRSDLSAAVTAALMPVDDSTTIGLPVPPLINMIVDYLQSAVSTYCDRAVLNDCKDLWEFATKYLMGALVIPTGSTFSGKKGRAFLIHIEPRRGILLRYRMDESRYEKFDPMPSSAVPIDALCFDPTNPNRMFACCNYSIWSIENDVTSVIVASHGFRLWQLVCSRDGATLWSVHRYGNQLVSVCTKSGTVSKRAGDGSRRSRDGVGVDACSLDMPFDLCWVGKNDQSLYILTEDGIRRFDVQSNRLSTLHPVKPDGSRYEAGPIRRFVPSAFVCTSGGWLVVSLWQSLYLIAPETGVTTFLAGSEVGHLDGDDLSQARFSEEMQLAVVDDEHSLLVVDRGNASLRRVLLPASLL